MFQTPLPASSFPAPGKLSLWPPQFTSSSNTMVWMPQALGRCHGRNCASLAPADPQLLRLLLRGILGTQVYGSSTESCFSFQCFNTQLCNFSDTSPLSFSRKSYSQDRHLAEDFSYQNFSQSRTAPHRSHNSDTIYLQAVQEQAFKQPFRVNTGNAPKHKELNPGITLEYNDQLR